MTKEEILDQLLDRWESAWEQGRDIPIDELCAEHPDCVEELKSWVRALKDTSWLEDNYEVGPQSTSSPTVDFHPEATERSASTLTLEAFTTIIGELGLVSTEELDSCCRELTSTGAKLETSTLAEKLIQTGKLTPYQTTVILGQKSDPLLIDRYVILDKLGSGGMGMVFKARHKAMDRVVALKLLPKEAVDSAQKVERFHREIKVAARLSHRNIVAGFDGDEWEGIHFLVMEHVQGQDLSQVVKSKGPLSWAQATGYILQASRGMEHAHRQGIIHRDIKPGNLLLRSRDDTIKVADLGLAQIRRDHTALNQQSTEELTTDGMVMGTVDFMSPEQATNVKEADERSDIYSLGCTLYYLIFGNSPYRGSTPMERLLSHRDESVPSLRCGGAEIPESLDRVFQRMVAKKPEDRYATMTEVISALEQCSQSTATRPRGQRRRARLLRVVGLCLLMISLGVIWWQIRSKSSQSSSSTNRLANRKKGTIKKQVGPPLAIAPFSAKEAGKHQEVWANHLGISVDITNSIGMKLKLIPPGQFLMGSTKEQVRRLSAYKEGGDYWMSKVIVEQPPRRTTVTQPFLIGNFEVTQAQYRRVMNANPSRFSKSKANKEKSEKLPVEMITWDEAVAFCKKLSNLPEELAAGREYRLPTEAEWEYACRAGTTTLFPTGDVLSRSDANFGPGDDPFMKQSNKPVLNQTTIPGSYPPNAFGLYEMLGNVWEWCSDYSSVKYDPAQTIDPKGGPPSRMRITRGGGWRYSAYRARPAWRGADYPHKRYPSQGLRVVCVMRSWPNSAPINFQKQAVPGKASKVQR